MAYFYVSTFVSFHFISFTRRGERQHHPKGGGGEGDHHESLLYLIYAQTNQSELGTKIISGRSVAVQPNRPRTAPRPQNRPRTALEPPQKLW